MDWCCGILRWTCPIINTRTIEDIIMKANLRVSLIRASDDRIYLEIECDDSHARIINADMNLDQFAYLVTGRGVDVRAEVKNLDKVGKIRETESCRYVVSKPYLSRDEAEKILKEEVIDAGLHQGYTVDTYLGSQTSIEPNRNGPGTVISYRIHRYVEPEK